MRLLHKRSNAHGYEFTDLDSGETMYAQRCVEIDKCLAVSNYITIEQNEATTGVQEEWPFRSQTPSARHKFQDHE